LPLELSEKARHKVKETTMFTHSFKQRTRFALVVVALVLATVVAAVPVYATDKSKPNPPVVRNKGNKYGALSARWWQWAIDGVSAADVPFLNTGGPVDISARQSGHVWFLAGANHGLTEPRTGVIPSGTSLFFPLGNFLNDYPCPPESNFEPLPGETMEHFLQRTGNESLDYYVPDPTNLFAEIDGVPLTGLPSYRATSHLFTFTADPALTDRLIWGDACITGSPQPGVAVGYWLLLPPLTPGKHTLHFGAPSMDQDITYVLRVKSGH
jgi:hypothetical protein